MLITNTFIFPFLSTKINNFNKTRVLQQISKNMPNNSTREQNKHYRLIQHPKVCMSPQSQSHSILRQNSTFKNNRHSKFLCLPAYGRHHSSSMNSSAIGCFPRKVVKNVVEPILNSRISKSKKLVTCLLTSTCQKLLNISIKFFTAKNVLGEFIFFGNYFMQTYLFLKILTTVSFNDFNVYFNGQLVSIQPLNFNSKRKTNVNRAIEFSRNQMIFTNYLWKLYFLLKTFSYFQY